MSFKYINIDVNINDFSATEQRFKDLSKMYVFIMLTANEIVKMCLQCTVSPFG